MSDLPDVPNQFAKSSNVLTTQLEDFCTVGLGIPLSKLHHWERPPDYDAYRVVMMNGLQFVVSGPELENFHKNWEYYYEGRI